MMTSTVLFLSLLLVRIFLPVTVGLQISATSASGRIVFSFEYISQHKTIRGGEMIDVAQRQRSN